MVCLGLEPGASQNYGGTPHICDFPFTKVIHYLISLRIIVPNNQIGYMYDLNLMAFPVLIQACKGSTLTCEDCSNNMSVVSWFIPMRRCQLRIPQWTSAKCRLFWTIQFFQRSSYDRMSTTASYRSPSTLSRKSCSSSSTTTAWFLLLLSKQLNG